MHLYFLPPPPRKITRSRHYYIATVYELLGILKQSLSQPYIQTEGNGGFFRRVYHIPLNHTYPLDTVFVSDRLLHHIIQRMEGGNDDHIAQFRENVLVADKPSFQEIISLHTGSSQQGWIYGSEADPARVPIPKCAFVYDVLRNLVLQKSRSPYQVKLILVLDDKSRHVLDLDQTHDDEDVAADKSWSIREYIGTNINLTQEALWSIIPYTQKVCVLFLERDVSDRHCILFHLSTNARHIRLRRRRPVGPFMWARTIRQETLLGVHIPAKIKSILSQGW